MTRTIRSLPPKMVLNGAVIQLSGFWVRRSTR